MVAGDSSPTSEVTRDILCHDTDKEAGCPDPWTPEARQLSRDDFPGPHLYSLCDLVQATHLSVPQFPHLKTRLSKTYPRVLS